MSGHADSSVVERYVWEDVEKHSRAARTYSLPETLLNVAILSPGLTDFTVNARLQQVPGNAAESRLTITGAARRRAERHTAVGMTSTDDAAPSECYCVDQNPMIACIPSPTPGRPCRRR